jgi:hypothetical protein
MIKLPPSLGFIDGTKVLVKIEPLLHKSRNKTIARELAGSWSSDDSIDRVFAGIAAERKSFDKKQSILDFAGILKDSPNFKGDIVQWQREIRDESR